MVQRSHADALGSDSLMTGFVIVGRIEIYLYLQQAIKLYIVFCQLGFLKAVKICLLELVLSYLAPEASIPYFNTIKF